MGSPVGGDFHIHVLVLIDVRAVVTMDDDSGGAAPVLSDDGGDVRVADQEGHGDNDIAVHVQAPVDNSGGDS